MYFIKGQGENPRSYLNTDGLEHFSCERGLSLIDRLQALSSPPQGSATQENPPPPYVHDNHGFNTSRYQDSLPSAISMTKPVWNLPHF